MVFRHTQHFVVCALDKREKLHIAEDSMHKAGLSLPEPTDHMTSSTIIRNYCRRVSWPIVCAINPQIFYQQTHTKPSFLFVPLPPHSQCEHDVLPFQFTIFFSASSSCSSRDLFFIFSPVRKFFLFHFNCTRSILLHKSTSEHSHTRSASRDR